MILGPSAALALPDVVGAHPDALVLVVAHSSTPIREGPTSSGKLDARLQAARCPVFYDLGAARNARPTGLAQGLPNLGCPPWRSLPRLGPAHKGGPFAQCRSVP